MKTTDINIRDPYVLLHDGHYYLYGTRSATCGDLRRGLTVIRAMTLKIGMVHLKFLNAVRISSPHRISGHLNVMPVTAHFILSQLSATHPSKKGFMC